MKPIFLILLATSLATVSLRAQTNSPAVAAPMDVTAAVLKGVDYFRAQAVTNSEGWFFPPGNSQRVTGYTNYVARYKEIEITVPGYKYETYETVVAGNTPSDPVQKVTRLRIIGLDPSKDRKITREVADPNGPIVKTVQLAIFEKGDGNIWSAGTLGLNGWTILALRRCGIAGDDPLVATPAGNLAQILWLYGLPDHLGDLAGLTAAFAVMPGDDYKRLTEQCASKLLDAQIVSGPATGLWGPLAIQPAMAAGFLKTLTRLGEEKKSLQAELALEQRKPKPTARRKSLEDQIQQVEARLGSLQSDLQRITQFGLRMYESVSGNARNGFTRLINQADQILLEGLPYLVQNQIGADLESTASAILALRVAFENGRLPMKTWRPETPKPAGPGMPPPAQDFPPARDVRDVLALTARVVGAARNASGQFPEMNVHQPVTDFAWFKSMPQVKPELMPKLAQPVTLASTVRGAAILANIQMMQAGLPKPTALETEACRALIPGMLQNKPLAAASDVARAPYNALLQTTALRNAKGKCLRQEFSTWNDIAEWLTSKQNPTGTWGRPSQRAVIASTSLISLREALGDMKAGDYAKSYDKPHLSPALLARGFQATYNALEEPSFTVAALLFLADGLPEGWIPSVAGGAADKIAP